MRAIVAGILFAAALAPFSTPAGATSLAGYRWKARPVVLFTPSTDDARYRAQRQRFQAASAGLAEREMVIVTVTAPSDPLRKTLGVGAKSFRVLLVGKDGHVAGRWSAPVNPFKLFALIDRMPMRRDEMRARGQ